MSVLSRRQLLGGSLASLCASQLALAGSSTVKRRFLFVHVEGGWDPLTVFAPKFDAPDIELDPEDEPLTVGNFHLVDGPGRAKVRSFFRDFGDQTLVLNGLGVRSVNHETCAAVALTGFTADDQPDWGTLIAQAARDEHILPHVVYSGPTFPGDYGVIVSRAAGQMNELMKGSLLRHQSPPRTLDSVSHFLAERAAMFEGKHPGLRHAVDWVEANSRSSELLANRNQIDLAYRGSLIGSARSAITALSEGLCRVATVGTGFVWDTHNNNSDQRYLFNDLFGDLRELVTLLSTTNGPEGEPLSTDTVIIVLSEMGRTPAFNLGVGRDHWPFTTALAIGPGLTTGREVGGYNDAYRGLGVNPTTGEIDPKRAGITALDLGATLLTLAGVDSKESLPQATPLLGLLS